jgi:hypothetical protein
MDIGWLYASRSGPETMFADLTIEEPNIPVVATTAVSAQTAGVYEGTPGTVASYVREYAVFTGPSSIDVVDVPPDPANNVYYVENCAYVRFRLTVFQATAWAQACVFRFPAPSPPTKPAPGPRAFDPKRRHTVADYRIGDGSGGDSVGTHRVLTLRRGSTLAVDELVGRSAAEAAAHLRIPRRRLEIARVRPRRPRGPEAEHLF